MHSLWVRPAEKDSMRARRVQDWDLGWEQGNVVREGSVGNLGWKRLLGREGSLRVDSRGRYSVAKC